MSRGKFTDDDDRFVAFAGGRFAPADEEDDAGTSPPDSAEETVKATAVTNPAAERRNRLDPRMPTSNDRTNKEPIGIRLYHHSPPSSSRTPAAEGISEATSPFVTGVPWRQPGSRSLTVSRSWRSSAIVASSFARANSLCSRPETIDQVLPSLVRGKLEINPSSTP